MPKALWLGSLAILYISSGELPTNNIRSYSTYIYIVKCLGMKIDGFTCKNNLEHEDIFIFYRKCEIVSLLSLKAESET